MNTRIYKLDHCNKCPEREYKTLPFLDDNKVAHVCCADTDDNQYVGGVQKKFIAWASEPDIKVDIPDWCPLEKAKQECPPGGECLQHEAQQCVSITNTVNPNDVATYLASSEGVKAIGKVLREHKDNVKRILDEPGPSIILGKSTTHQGDAWYDVETDGDVSVMWLGTDFEFDPEKDVGKELCFDNCIPYLIPYITEQPAKEMKTKIIEFKNGSSITFTDDDDGDIFNSSVDIIKEVLEGCGLGGYIDQEAFYRADKAIKTIHAKKLIGLVKGMPGKSDDKTVMGRTVIGKGKLFINDELVGTCDRLEVLGDNEKDEKIDLMKPCHPMNRCRGVLPGEDMTNCCRYTPRTYNDDCVHLINGENCYRD